MSLIGTCGICSSAKTTFLAGRKTHGSEKQKLNTMNMLNGTTLSGRLYISMCYHHYNEHYQTLLYKTTNCKAILNWMALIRKLSMYKSLSEADINRWCTGEGIKNKCMNGLTVDSRWAVFARVGISGKSIEASVFFSSRVMHCYRVTLSPLKLTSVHQK